MSALNRVPAPGDFVAKLRRGRQPVTQLDPGFTDTKQQLDNFPKHSGILLNLRRYHLAAQHGVKARHIRRQFAALFQVEGSFQLLQHQESMLHLRAAEFDIARFDCLDGTMQIAGQNVVEHDHQVDGAGAAHCCFLIRELVPPGVHVFWSS